MTDDLLSLADWLGKSGCTHVAMEITGVYWKPVFNIYLRGALVQAAWAATRSKETYLTAQYQRLVKRLGKKKALLAVGHSILIIGYHVLKNKASYRELGGD